MLITIAFLLGLSYRVTSYTMAKVENTMAIVISSSEDALVGLPENLYLEVEKLTTVTQLETIRDADLSMKIDSINTLGTIVEDVGDIIVGTSTETTVQNNMETIIEYNVDTKIATNIKGYNFYVKNNLNEIIDVVIFLDKGYSREQYLGFNIVNPRTTIFPGKTEEILFVVDENIETERIDVIISAKWSKGSAEIKKVININVIEFTPVYVYETIDLSTKKIPVAIINNEDIIEPTIIYDDLMKTNETLNEVQLIESIDNDTQIVEEMVKEN